VTILQVVAQRNHSTHPHAFALRSGNLVADAFPRYLALKLCKGQQHIQGQSSHGRGGIELLGDRHEADTLLIKLFDHLGEVGQGAGEPINFIDNHGVDAFRGDII
jgi:hypothetical protein